MAKNKMSKAEVLFCNAVALGNKSIKECLVDAYPKYKKASKTTVETQAFRLVRRPDIMDKIVELKQKCAEKVENKYANLKEELIDRMVKGIREGTDPAGCAIEIVNFIPAIKQISTMLGYDAPKDINLRNGGYAADYRGPPTLLSMSDEEISAKLAEMRNADGE